MHARSLILVLATLSVSFAFALGVLFLVPNSDVFAASKVQPCWDDCARVRVACVNTCGPGVCGTLPIEKCAKQNTCVQACWNSETACHKKCIPGQTP